MAYAFMPLGPTGVQVQRETVYFLRCFADWQVPWGLFWLWVWPCRWVSWIVFGASAGACTCWPKGGGFGGGKLRRRKFWVGKFSTPPNIGGALCTVAGTTTLGMNSGYTKKKIFWDTPWVHKIVLWDTRATQGKILLPSAVHLEERLTVSQSVPEPASRQSVRYTQFGFFVSGRCGPKQQGGPVLQPKLPAGRRFEPQSCHFCAAAAGGGAKIHQTRIQTGACESGSGCVTIGPLAVLTALCVPTACSLLSKNF